MDIDRERERGSDWLSCHDCFECGEYEFGFGRIGDKAMGELEGQRDGK